MLWIGVTAVDTRELGRRLKEARLNKKLTQAEVVGDFITRNMLSQIESGLAMPSMKTLSYLSEQLSIPLSQLLDTPASSDAIEELNSAKRAFSAGNYPLAVTIAEKLELPFFDEANAILARAHLALAQKYWKERELASAAANARLAAEKAQLGIYASRTLRSEALLLLDEGRKRQ
ncbi:MAG TPA: helix-turn-helix transcriptional regulator [Feifaniaceae bacterium]|nr:helix-turn-helix transcriptional regulator [Feifaniaceae bacterium]